MFDDWKRAWREAVTNFHQELRGGTDDADGSHTRALRREVSTAKGALAQLDREIRATERQLEEERTAAADCVRREELARNVGDDETVRLAVEFGTRHRERAGVLARKVEVLFEERALLARDVEKMQAMVGSELSGATPRPAIGDDDADERAATEFRDLGRRARERTAEERLEELKRRMGQ
jgi:hypothetical protein